MSSRVVPVITVPGQIAVGDRELARMLGLDDGRSVAAQKRAIYRLTRRHGIDRLPGRVWPLARIEAAIGGRV